MNRKSVWLGSLVATLLGLGAVRGQAPAMLPADAGTTKPAPAAAPVVPPPPSGSISDWMAGSQPCGCCGPIGFNGPILAEAYIRSGVSFPVGGAIFSKTMDNGWDIEGGVRSLFLNKHEDAAWVVELGITNIFNPGTTNGLVIGLSNETVTTASTVIGGAPTSVVVPNLDVTIKNLNRTYIDLAVGREYWLLGNAETSHDQLNLRVGADFGGRWGTDKVELNGFNHLTATIGGVFMAIYTDVEIPCGSLIFFGGIRGEWGYTWDQVLQTSHNGENNDLNLLFQLGVRF